MLREPPKNGQVEQRARPRNDSKQGRFRLVKLEERIAPVAPTSPHTGHGHGHKGGFV
jgi:hypothetical protein